MVMEWCEGGSLDSAVAQQVFCMPSSGAWGQQADALKISATLLDIASGVGYLHQMHIVHRDLKLKNVLLRRSQVCLEMKSNCSLCLCSMIQQTRACLCLPGQVNRRPIIITCCRLTGGGSLQKWPILVSVSSYLRPLLKLRSALVTVLAQSPTWPLRSWRVADIQRLLMYMPLAS